MLTQTRYLSIVIPFSFILKYLLGFIRLRGYTNFSLHILRLETMLFYRPGSTLPLRPARHLLTKG